VPGLVHGNRGRTANNRVDERVRVKIQELAKEEYKDYNDSHFTEELIDEHDWRFHARLCAAFGGLWVRKALANIVLPVIAAVESESRKLACFYRPTVAVMIG
jgi:DNA-binding GntR family transcriptional regulator